MNHTAFDSLKKLYARMDDAWDQAAGFYGFRCDGCEDNCCKSLFFHHTYIEKAYFLEGFNSLAPEKKKNILHRAKQYYTKTFKREGTLESRKIMCPANESGKCMLYAFRPMICRLHGLPHELSRPGGEIIRGNGCSAGGFDTRPYKKFDRTPFYTQMAQIEMAYRKTNGMTGGIKECIAQILLTEEPETDK